MKNERLAGLDILKIVSMFLIVTSHFAVHGNWPPMDTITLNSGLISLFGSFGNLAVNCYVLITAYFMVDKNLNVERIARILFKVLFYSVGIYILLSLLGFVTFDIKTFLLYLPFREKSYWFMDTYILLILFSPLLNIIMNKITKMQLRYLIFVSLFFSSVLSLVYLVDTVVSYFFWFIVLYFIGGYLRKYYNSSMKISKRWIIVILLMFAMFSTIIILRVIELNTGVIIGSGSYYFIGKNRLLVLVTSIQMFVLFSCFKVRSNKIIQFMSGNTLGVYLIHDNGALRYILWHVLLNVGNYFYSRGFIVYALLIIIGVFLTSMLVSYLITLCIENPLFYLLKKPVLRLQEKYDKLWNS